ncbi:uncharacterized protein LOC123373324 isoform X3 [Mauremys mutica]|uniref:uncharacterized protein LOC123373324 isoform X3 n=1 Tax=Mauremys mutica TaxID=74926 RepID=UPI001D16D6D5|nr:uncharacterized protein LOC123373324 isoform X3 [Mauremys mutica]
MQLSGPCLSVGTVERQSSWPDHRRRNASEIAPLSVPALEQNWRQRQFWVVAKRSTRGAPHSQKSCRATCQWSDHSYWRENTLLRPRPAHVDSRNCIWACTWDRELPFRSQSSRSRMGQSPPFTFGIRKYRGRQFGPQTALSHQREGPASRTGTLQTDWTGEARTPYA